MLAVASEFIAVNADFFQRVEERVDRSVSGAVELDLSRAFNKQSALEGYGVLAVLALLVDLAFGELELCGMIEVVFLKYVKQLFGDKLASQSFALCLNQRGKLGVHSLGQVVAEVVAHYKRRAALA